MNQNKFKFLLVSVIFGGALLFFASNIFLSSQASVSGIVHFTRLKPEQKDKGELYILQKKYQSESAFQETGIIALLKDDSPWVWDKAEKGKTYEMKAQLRIDGKVIKDSESIVVSVPAKEQVLSMKITWDDLPDYVVKEQTVIMGGDVQVNGFIPNKSVLEVQTKTSENVDFITQWTNNTVVETNTWKWESAVPKTKYEMKAVLFSNNEVIGESAIRQESGITTNEVSFLINSKAKNTQPIQPTTSPQQNTPTPQKSSTSIKGSYMINGPEDANTSILIMWTVPGQNQWQEISRIKNPANGTQSWEWNGAKSGELYEIGISLQVNEKVTATTQNKIVSAPANDVNFILNTGINVPVPSNKPTLQSCTNNINNQWDANITVPVNDRYGNYWVQIGSTMGGGELYSNKVKPPSNDSFVRMTVKVNDRQSYYARYAYSFCSNCNADVNFSNFSDSLTFSCGSAPQPTAAPQPTSVPQPTVTSVPPSPTLPPYTSQCNETCGSNGYSCVLGLECESTDIPGNSACRNPNCTDRTNCICL